MRGFAGCSGTIGSFDGKGCVRTCCDWSVGGERAFHPELPRLHGVAGEEHAFEFFGKVDLKSGGGWGVGGRRGGEQRGGACGRNGVRERACAGGGEWV